MLPLWDNEAQLGEAKETHCMRTFMRHLPTPFSLVLVPWVNSQKVNYGNKVSSSSRTNDFKLSSNHFVFLFS